MMGRPLTTTLFVAAGLAVALSGCGRRGGLEPPPSTVAQKQDQAAGQKAKDTVKDRPFILDKLIE